MTKRLKDITLNDFNINASYFENSIIKFEMLGPIDVVLVNDTFKLRACILTHAIIKDK